MSENNIVVGGSTPKKNTSDGVSIKRSRKTMSKWSHDEIVRLIEHVEVEPALWDSGRADYKDRQKRQQIMHSISLSLNKTINDVTNKWQNLRSQFNAERRKCMQQKDGQGTDEFYSSRWEYYNSLKFIQPSSRFLTTSTSNLEMNAESSCDLRGSSYADMNIPGSPYLEGNQCCQPIQLSSTPAKKRGKTPAKPDQRTALANRAVKIMQRPQDSAQIFGYFVADKSRHFSPRQRRHAENVMQRIILDACGSENDWTSNWSLDLMQGSKSNADINDADYVSENLVFKVADEMIDQEYIIPESPPNTQKQSPIDVEIKIENEIIDQEYISLGNPHNTQQQQSSIDSTIKVKNEIIDPTYNPSQSPPNIQLQQSSVDPKIKIKYEIINPTHNCSQSSPSTQQQQSPLDSTIKIRSEITDLTNISSQNPPSTQKQQSSPEDSTIEVKNKIIDHNYTPSQNVKNGPNGQQQQSVPLLRQTTSTAYSNGQSNSTNPSSSKIKRKRNSLTRILRYSQQKLEKMETIEMKKFKLMEERNNLFATSLENIATTLKNVATTLEDISIKLNRKK